jgi:hypothetical protein
MNLAQVILKKRFEAIVEVADKPRGKKIDAELSSMMVSYVSALRFLSGENKDLYYDPYHAIMALRRELSSVRNSDELTNELSEAIKKLKNEESKKLSA